MEIREGCQQVRLPKIGWTGVYEPRKLHALVCLPIKTSIVIFFQTVQQKNTPYCNTYELHLCTPQLFCFFRFFSIFHFHVLVTPASFFFLPLSCLAIPPPLSSSICHSLASSGYCWGPGKVGSLEDFQQLWQGGGRTTGAQFLHLRGQGRTSFIHEDRDTLLSFKGPHYLFFRRTGARLLH